MRNNFCKLVAIGSVISMALVGCDTTAFDADTMAKMEHIGENVATISEHFSEENTAELTADIEAASEAATELTEDYNEKMEEAQKATEEYIEEVLEAEPEEEENQEIDADESIINEAELYDLFELVKGNVIAEILEYKELGKGLLNDALSKRDEGIAKINKGLKAIPDVIDNTDQDDVENVIDSTFDNVELVIDGADDVAASATVAISEAAKWTRELIDMAQILGVDNKKLDEAKVLLKKAESTQIQFIPDDAGDRVEAYRASVKSNIKKAGNVDFNNIPKVKIDIDVTVNPSEVIEETMNQAEGIVDYSEEVLSQAEDLYKAANMTAQSIIDVAHNSGIESDRIDEVENMLNGYKSAISEGIAVSKSDLDTVKGYLNTASKYAKSQEFEKYLSKYGFNK